MHALTYYRKKRFHRRRKGAGTYRVCLRALHQLLQLTDEKIGLLQRMVSRLVDLVPCTDCRYCCEACPNGLDIPILISLYSGFSFEPSPGSRFTVNALTDKELPSNCIACGECKKLMPPGDRHTDNHG